MSKQNIAKMLSICSKSGQYTLNAFFNFLSIVNDSHKIWGSSIITIFGARIFVSFKLDPEECLRLTSSLRPFVLRVPLPENVHPHTGHLHR